MIGTIFQGQNIKTASKEEMPIYLLNALVAKEDERFMERRSGLVGDHAGAMGGHPGWRDRRGRAR